MANARQRYPTKTTQQPDDQQQQTTTSGQTSYGQDDSQQNYDVDYNGRRRWGSSETQTSSAATGNQNYQLIEQPDNLEWGFSDPDLNSDPAPTQTTSTQQDWSTGEWDAARVAAYFAWRGVTPRATSAEYWAQKWNEFGRNDPAYFLERLKNAEEFGGGSGTSGGDAYATTETSSWTKEMREKLLEQLALASQPVDENDPTIRQIMTGAQIENARAQEMERHALSERLFANQDLNSNSINQQVQQSAERTAGKMATLKGTLMQQELESRRSTIQNLLNEALASGDAEAAREIQVALANLDARIAREQMGGTLAMYEQDQNSGATNKAAGN